VRRKRKVPTNSPAVAMKCLFGADQCSAGCGFSRPNMGLLRLRLLLRLGTTVSIVEEDMLLGGVVVMEWVLLVLGSEREWCWVLLR
jgi:hypothetical protein